MADQPTNRTHQKRSRRRVRKDRAHAWRRARARRRGFTLVELMVVLVVLTISVSMFSTSLVATAKQGQIKRERAIAAEAVRRLFETMRSDPFRELFALYDADPSNDPAGAGTAPGAGFVVQGLDARPGDPDGRVGLILFPTQGAALREDAIDATLGMPRDLDADGAIDTADHADDYKILPLRIVVEWKGAAGLQSLEMSTMFVDI